MAITLRVQHFNHRVVPFGREFDDTRIKFEVDESSAAARNFLQALTLWFLHRYN